MTALTSEAREELAGFTTSDLDELRSQARGDLYVLSKGVLGFKDVTPQAHGGFTRFIQGSPKKRRLGLMPRAHLKSTLGTVAHSLQLGIQDPENARVLIVSEVATLAEGFLKQVMGHCESNEIFRALFGDLIPERFNGPGVTWRHDRASLRRNAVLDAPTWRATGVGSEITGSHFTNIKCDDLIGFDALRSPAVMSRTKAWVDSIEPLLVNQHNDYIDFIGTRWSRNDLYAHIIEGYGDTLAVFTRSAIEDSEIIFPALHTWDEYHRIQRINPALWAAQYENNPLTSLTTDFPVGMLRTYRFLLRDQLVELDIPGQPAKQWDVEQLDRVLTADPNSGSLVAPDAAALTVTGLSPDDEAIVLESWSGRVSPSDFVDQIYNFARKWDVRIVGIEKAGQQNTDHYFKLKAERENYYVPVESLRPGTKQSKEDRVRASLQPIIRSGLLFVPLHMETLRHQLSNFPDIELWDEVDSLAYGPRLWRKPPSRERLERSSNVIEKLMAMRDPITGY